MCELVIGIDPDISKIPDCYKTEQNIKLFEWGVDILTLCQNKVKAVKFQSAYFENFGLFGMQTLASLIREAKNANIKVIMDAKRGDIGSTSAAYAQAYLSQRNYAGNNEFESTF